MTIHFDPAAIDTAANTQLAPALNPALRSNAPPTAAPTAKETQKEPLAVSPTIGAQEPNLTFRRYPNGRVYYVVTDPQSGNEIQELPPQDVRYVGERIDEYSKQQQAKVTQHVNVKS